MAARVAPVAPVPDAPPAPPGNPAPRAGRRLNWRDPKVLAVGIGGAVGLVVLIRKRGRGTSTSDTGATSSNGTLIPAATADTTSTDVVNTLQPEIDALANAIGNLNNAAPAPQPPPPSGNPPPVTPFQHALATATPQQLQNFVNMAGWITANPGKDFNKALWDWTHHGTVPYPGPGPNPNDPTKSGHF